MKKNIVSNLLLIALVNISSLSIAQAVVTINWESLPTEGKIFKKICVRDDPKNKWQAWGLDTKDNVYLWKPQNYKTLPGQLKQLSYGQEKDKDKIWGTNSKDIVYAWHSTKWERAGGALRLLSIGPKGHTWGVNGKMQVWQRVGKGWKHKAGTPLTHISVGPLFDDKHEMVWGVNEHGEVYEWNGKTFIENTKWSSSNGTLNKIFIGLNKQIWGITTKNKVFLWNQKEWVPQWPNQKFKKILTAPNGTIYAITLENIICQMVNSEWQSMGVQFKDVAIGKNGEMWGITEKDNIILYEKGVWEKIKSDVQDFAVDADGTLWYTIIEKKSYGTKPAFFAEVQEVVPSDTDKKKPNYFYQVTIKDIGISEGTGFLQEMSSGKSVWALSEKGSMYKIGKEERSEYTPVVTIGKSKVTHIGNTLHPKSWPWISAEQITSGKTVELLYTQNPKNQVWSTRGLPNYAAAETNRKEAGIEKIIATRTKQSTELTAKEKEEKEMKRRIDFEEYKKQELIRIKTEENLKEKNFDKEYLNKKNMLITEQENLKKNFELNLSSEIEKLKKETEKKKQKLDEEKEEKTTELKKIIDEKITELKAKKENAINSTEASKLQTELFSLQMKKFNVGKTVDKEIAREKEKLAVSLQEQTEKLKTDNPKPTENISEKLAKLEEEKEERKNTKAKNIAALEAKWAAEETKRINEYEKEKAEQKEDMVIKKESRELLENLMKQKEQVAQIDVGNQAWVVTAKKYLGETYYPENNIFFWRFWGLKWGWHQATGRLKQISVGMHGRTTWGVTPEGSVVRRVF
ncbi:hypothetical protein KKA53_02640 [Candidatus Dependentiae bacterium]|nr:hypothetical protein [Candidatus Dependentiae bacterium]